MDRSPRRLGPATRLTAGPALALLLVATGAACSFPGAGPRADGGGDGASDRTGNPDTGPADQGGDDGAGPGDRPLDLADLSEGVPPDGSDGPAPDLDGSDGGDCLAGCPIELRLRTGSCLCGLGDGSDGALAVASGTKHIVDESFGTFEGSQDSLTATASFGGRQLAPGTLVLLHQTRGQNATGWEFNVVRSHDVSTVEFELPLNRNYLSDAGANRAQLIRVPQYSQVLVADGGVLTVRPWDGQRGGILALSASVDLTVAGTVDVVGLGFLGGSSATQCGLQCLDGQAGESADGEPRPGSVPNGAGGGGGGLGDCNMGGGGGHRTRGEDGTTLGPNACSGGATPGTGGGPFGVPDLTRKLPFGAGGGEGSFDDDGALPGPGGPGGGIAMLMARSMVLTGAGRINADGVAGRPPNEDLTCTAIGVYGMGSGGGGAGGSVMLLGQSLDLGDGVVRARGGAGGPLGTRAPCPAGLGGSGGDGRVGVRGAVNGTTDPDYAVLP